ncbi:MAG TPA: ATP-binding cassette domain-containing protein [bacterium]|nr:ATP-binding cassette domain-containing protein [bacterium]
MELALKVEKLAKSYTRRIHKPGLLGSIQSLFSGRTEDVPAVRGVSFTIGRGERVGLIGENGAGKSTTLKMLTGIIVPTGGTLEVLGLLPWKQRRELALNIGVVFGQRPQLLWDIPVRETFRLLKTMYRIPEEVYQVTYSQAVKRLGLEPLLGTPVRQLSLGQRMRCDLAAALLHAPAVAFLDEPTIGLDLSVKEQVREFIADMQERFGTTLLITTHDLKDITETCDRLLLLDKGTLLFDGSLKAFETRFARESRIVAELHRPIAPAALKKLTAEMKRHGGKVLEAEGHRLVVEYRKAGAAPALTQALLRGPKVADLTLEKTDIETIVTRIYRQKD